MNFFTNFTLDKLLYIPAALLAIMVHEVCHGFAAYLLGDHTAKSMGRLSFNPIKHIDIFGLAMLIFVGFGWAKPVPVDMRYFKNPKRGMALTALAGPASNFVFAFLSLTIMSFLDISYYQGSFFAPSDIGGASYWIGMFLLYCAMINVGLGVFNLFPIPPLDGSKMLGAVLPDHIYYRLLSVERYGMIVLMLALWSGFLDAPLGFLRNLIMTGLYTAASVPAKLVLSFIG